MATRTALNISAPTIDIERGPKFAISLPESAGVLSQDLQNIARQYLGARRRSGEALLEAARHLSTARQQAKHGEWAIFLEAIGLDESRARAQIRIHEEAQRDPLFADRIVNGFLSETVARELLPAPPEVREAVLARDEPPTLQDVREAKRASTPVLEPAQKPNISEQPTTDAGKVAAIQRYLDQQRAAGRIYDKATFNAAWELAHEIHDGDTWRDITKAIHAQTNGGKGAPVAPPAAAAPFWQSMSPNHPGAHLWTRTGMNEHHAACGMIASRAPSGSTEAGHCSSCVRATWPQNQAEEPKIPEVAAAAPARQMCPTCGEAILNGIWGELEECGSCYHARVRVPTPPDLAQLDATIPPALEQAGYYWHSATPPIIAHNDGWRGERPTIEQALQLAWDRERARQADAADPVARARAFVNGLPDRALLSDAMRLASDHIRALIAIIEKGEAED